MNILFFSAASFFLLLTGTALAGSTEDARRAFFDIENGFINSIDDKLTTYLPALIGSAYDGVTIKQALQMDSRVEWNEDSYDMKDTNIPLTCLHENSMVEQRFRMLEGANALPRAAQPGSKFNYNTLETCRLGWLVENVTGL